jgi:hypothetical protein
MQITRKKIATAFGLPSISVRQAFDKEMNGNEIITIAKH